MNVVSGAIVVVAVLMILNSAFTIYLSLYTWSSEERFARSHAPRSRREPRLSFTLLIPARDEARVIGDTIREVAALRYPRYLFDTLVICEASDLATIAAVEHESRLLAGHRVRLVTFDGPPINKPRALNVGLETATGDVIGIFDAEDEPDPDVLDIVNTIMTEEGVRVVQSGVQLMNVSSRWYSGLNVLEYFFWFKSRLHFFARHHAIPLGGNTVFFDRALLETMGGWNDACLTEDAEIGIRLSARDEPIRIVYDDEKVTREECPPTVGALMRQRTRWSQGFLQIAAGGQWLGLRQLDQRFLALYTLLFPLFQAATIVLLPLAFFSSLGMHAPTAVAMLTLVPLYLTGMICIIQMLGLAEFARIHRLPMPWRQTLLLPVVYLPYNWVLGYAALRAVIRQIRGHHNWEKTPHIGVHRQPALAVARLSTAGSGTAGGAPAALASQSFTAVTLQSIDDSDDG